MSEATSHAAPPHAAPPGRRLRIAVGLATAGRREMLSQTLTELGRQTRAPDVAIVCPAAPEDYDEAAGAACAFPVRAATGPRGLCAQRNAILQAAIDVDLIVFFDDDFFPTRDFLAQTEAIFLARPDAVMVTGEVAADGATGPGFSPQAAREIIARVEQAPAEARLKAVHNGYGCNMTARMAPIVEHGLRFDEALPLYAWLEDVDFSRRLVIASGGKVLEARQCRGVHLGVKGGRIAGLRYGYSQIANPLHIFNKGVLTPAWTLNQIMRNVLANLAHWAKPEPWVDRKGRLRGNLLAVRDLIAGRLHPENILKLG